MRRAHRARIHGYVSAAYHGHLLCQHDGSGTIFLICLHQIDAGQIFVGAVHAFQVFSRYSHKAGQARAGADKNRFIAHVKQLVHRKGFADHHIGFHADPKGLQGVYLLLHDGLRQAKLGDAVYKHTACLVQRLKHTVTA